MVHGFAPAPLGLAVVLWTAKQFAVFDTVYLVPEQRGVVSYEWPLSIRKCLEYSIVYSVIHDNVIVLQS